MPGNMAFVSNICKTQPAAPLAFLPQSEEEQVCTEAGEDEISLRGGSGER